MAENIETINAYKLKEASELIGVHFTTLNGWFKDLENRGIHYLHKDAIGDRIFLELDISIGKHIVAMREKKASLASIFESLSDTFELNTIPPIEENGLSTRDQEAMNTIFKSKEFSNVINGLVESRVKEILNQQETIKGILEGSKEERMIEQRTAALDAEIMRIRVKKKLRDEAVSEWEKLPEDKRNKKVAIFWKVEDVSFKQEFVDRYIADRLEERLRNELTNK